MELGLMELDGINELDRRIRETEGSKNPQVFFDLFNETMNRYQRQLIGNFPGENMASFCHLKDHRIVRLVDQMGKPTKYFLYDTEETCMDNSCGRKDNIITLHRFLEGSTNESIAQGIERLTRLYAASTFSDDTPERKFIPESLEGYLEGIRKLPTLMQLQSYKDGGVNGIRFSQHGVISFISPNDKKVYCGISSYSVKDGSMTYESTKSFIEDFRRSYK